MSAVEMIAGGPSTSDQLFESGEALRSREPTPTTTRGLYRIDHGGRASQGGIKRCDVHLPFDRPGTMPASSVGKGKMMVEFCSPAMTLNVLR